MTLTAEKAVKHIINFENGTLYLKLKEEFDTRKMQIHCTLAKISKSNVRIVKADSEGEVSSTSMGLSAEEMDLLEEGRQIVKRWWDADPLKNRHVLLDCGHIWNWDDWNEWMNEHSNTPGEYTAPNEDTYYCFECESSYHVHRFNAEDFL